MPSRSYLASFKHFNAIMTYCQRFLVFHFLVVTIPKLWILFTRILSQFDSNWDVYFDFVQSPAHRVSPQQCQSTSQIARGSLQKLNCCSTCSNVWRKFPSNLKARRSDARMSGVRTKIFSPSNSWYNFEDKSRQRVMKMLEENFSWNEGKIGHNEVTVVDGCGIS